MDEWVQEEADEDCVERGEKRTGFGPDLVGQPAFLFRCRPLIG